MEDPEAFQTIAATVVRGHRVASGLANDPSLPDGTIRPQLPLLRAVVPALAADLHAATINLSVGVPVRPRAPEHRVPNLRWWPTMPAETFFLSRARLSVAGDVYPAWLYMPDPETKPAHFQAADVIELLAPWIEGLGYGSAVMLGYPGHALAIG